MFEVQGRSRSTSVILRLVVLVLLCYTVASGKNKLNAWKRPKVPVHAVADTTL